MNHLESDRHVESRTPSRFIRRVLGQWSSKKTPPRGKELGLMGGAAQLVIDDEHRAAAFRMAACPRERQEAAFAYFMKVAKNAREDAEYRRDRYVLDLLDDVYDELAEELVTRTNRIKELVEARAGSSLPTWEADELG